MKIYKKPIITVTFFSNEDILTTSSGDPWNPDIETFIIPED